jgi:DegV family protein with EDD domain
MSIRIVTDSTAGIQPEIIDKLGIHVVPLSLVIDGKNYQDGLNITNEEFMIKMREASEIPKSSQPSVGSFLEVYDSLGKEGHTVISIHMTEGMSGTFNAAQSAAEISKTKIKVINSGFISILLGYFVEKAAEMAQLNAPFDEIVKEVNKMKSRGFLYVVVDTLENLIKGGRIGKGRGMIGTLLNIKPIASLENGVYTPVTKVRSHSQAVKFLVAQVKKDLKDKKIARIGIAHADALPFANKIRDALKTEYNFDHIDIMSTTSVVSIHTGPGAIGLMYYTHE